MGRYRHVRHVRVEHAAIVGTVVLGIGLLTFLPLSDDASAASQQSVVASSSATNADYLQQLAQFDAVDPVATVSSSPAASAGAAVAKPKPKPRKRNPAITPSGWRLPVTSYSFSARFGQPGSWARGWHTGLDFVTNEYRVVGAPLDGVVVAASYEGAYGNLLRIKVKPHMELWFAHLNDILVQPGQRVKRGDSVAHVGMTGNTTGPHLHFEVRINDEPQDPEHFFWPDGHSRTFPVISGR